MSILTFNEFTSSNPSGYKLASVNNFLKEKFYINLEKEVLNFTKSQVESWNSAKSADLQSSQENYKTFGGGYEGDTIKKFKESFSKKKSPNILTLINKLSSNEFVKYVYKNLKIKEIPQLVDSSYVESLFDFLLKKKYVYINFKLSAYPPKSGIALHRDNQRKAIGMLLYFGFSDSKKRKKGGTQFYSDHLAPKNWSNFQKNHEFSESEMLTLCLDKEPLSNSFAAFEINDHSWHGVKSYEDSNEDLYRINLQINFMRIKNQSFLNKLAKRIFS